MYYPDYNNGYKSRFYQYSPKLLFVYIFFFIEIFNLGITLILSNNTGLNNNLINGIAFFSLIITLMFTYTLYVNREENKNWMIHYERTYGRIIFFGGTILIFSLVIFVYALINERSEIFFTRNLIFSIIYMATALGILAILSKLSEKPSNSINANTRIVNILTKDSTEKLFEHSEDKDIRLFISDNIGDLEKIAKTIFNEQYETHLKINKRNDYYEVRFLNEKSLNTWSSSEKLLNKGNHYYWFVDFKDKADLKIEEYKKTLHLFLSENNDDFYSDNQYILVRGNKNEIEKLHYVAATLSNNVIARYFIEIENFRLQDLDEDRKTAVSRLIEQSFFQNNNYNGSIIKTNITEKNETKSKKNNDEFFKTNHIFFMIEEEVPKNKIIQTVKNIQPKVTDFYLFYNEIQIEMSGFNVKTSLVSKSKSIEILHNIYSNKNIQNSIIENSESINDVDFSKFESFVNFKEFIKNEHKKINELIQFEVIKEDSNCVTIAKPKKNNEKQKPINQISFSHAETLPLHDNDNVFNRLFMRNVDETIKITYKKYPQNSKKNKVHKHLRNSEKYFKKLYPDKKMYKMKYLDDKDKVISSIIQMYEKEVYQLSVDVIEKYNIEIDLNNSDTYSYRNQDIRMKRSKHNNTALASSIMTSSEDFLTNRKKYTFLGVFLTTGNSLSNIEMFGEAHDYEKDGLYIGVNLDVSKQSNVNVPVLIDFAEYTDYSKDNAASSNGHMVVIGKSGSGKTFLTKSIIHQKRVNSKRQVIVFDIEDDYQSITKIKENDVLKDRNKSKTIDIASYDDVINPFRVIYHQDEISNHKKDKTDEELSKSLKKIISRHIYFLQNFIKDMFHILNDEFDSELYSLISKVYKNQGIDVNDISITAFKEIKSYPTMENMLLAINKRREEINNEQILQEKALNYEKLNELYISIENQLIEHLKDPYWNQKFNKDNNENKWDDYDFIRINLKELIRSSQIIQTYKLGLKLLMQQLEIYIFNRNVPNKPYAVDSRDHLGVFITVDEAHRYFKKDLLFMVDFFAAIAKQGRKRVIELAMISQNISDFYRQSDSKDIEQKASDIIKNSGYKFVMQVAQDFDRIYDFIESGYQLSDAEKTRIKSLNRYRVYLIQGPFKRTLIQTDALMETFDFYTGDL